LLATSPHTGNMSASRQQLSSAAAPASAAVGPPAAGGSRLAASCGAMGGLDKGWSGGSKARVFGAAGEGAVAGHPGVSASDASDPARLPGETRCWLCLSPPCRNCACSSDPGKPSIAQLQIHTGALLFPCIRCKDASAAAHASIPRDSAVAVTDWNPTDEALVTIDAVWVTSSQLFGHQDVAWSCALWCRSGCLGG
jgi:hypothetical protein